MFRSYGFRSWVTWTFDQATGAEHAPQKRPMSWTRSTNRKSFRCPESKIFPLAPNNFLRAELDDLEAHQTQSRASNPSPTSGRARRKKQTWRRGLESASPLGFQPALDGDSLKLSKSRGDLSTGPNASSRDHSSGCDLTHQGPLLGSPSFSVR